MLLLAAASCRGGHGTERTPDPVEAEVDLGIIKEHSWGFTRYRGIDSAITGLLRARAAIESDELDPSIRELTKVLCRGASPDVMARIESEPVERLYPVDGSGQCTHVVCGGCGTSGAWVSGAAFPSGPPHVDPRAPIDADPGTPLQGATGSCAEDLKLDPYPYSAHVALAEGYVRVGRGLRELLISRRLLAVAGTDTTALDGVIREVMWATCGGGTVGGVPPDREAIVKRTPIDDLFPAVPLASSTSAGCGVLFMRDGTVVRGRGVTWTQ